MLNLRTTIVLTLCGLLWGWVPTTPTPKPHSAPNTFRIPMRYLPGKTPANLKWLENSWNKEDGEFSTWEVWKWSESGMMMGTGVTIKDQKVEVFAENLQIQNVQDRLVLIATVNLNVPVLFTLIAINEEGGWVFENKEHDAPNRLIYQAIDEEHLTVFIETDTPDGVTKSAVEYVAKKLPRNLESKFYPKE